MKAIFFNIKPYDDSFGVSILIDLYNKMKKYLNPETTVLITEEATHAFLGKETVLPNYQHRKIGSGLLALGIDILQKRGCKTIELSVDSENEKALSLYRKFGFHVNEKLTQKSYQIM